MITNLLTYLNILKKYVIIVLVSLVSPLLSLHSQIKYIPSNERTDAGMGVDRVARFFTPAYESKPAKNDEEIRWVQIDLGETKKIDGIKLLPRVSVWGYVQSEGFPSRFKIEVSDDPGFGTSIMYENRTREDYKDPFD